MASYMKAIDYSKHPVAVHTHPNDLSLYHDIVGDPLFDAASVQYATPIAGGIAETVRNLSKNAGRKWVVDMDENGHYQVGANGSNSDQMRCEVLYDVLFANGGVEWYAGYHNLPLGGDVRMENFRTRESLFKFSRIAREFMAEHVENFHLLGPADHLVSSANDDFGGAEAMARSGQDFVIFLPNASSTPTLDLSNFPGNYRVRWFNPRTGEETTEGPMIQGGAPRTVQVMGANPNADWIVLLDRQ